MTLEELHAWACTQWRATPHPRIAEFAKRVAVRLGTEPPGVAWQRASIPIIEGLRSDPRFCELVLALLEEAVPTARSYRTLEVTFRAMIATRHRAMASPIRALGARYLTRVNTRIGAFVSARLRDVAEQLAALPPVDLPVALAHQLAAHAAQHGIALPPIDDGDVEPARASGLVDELIAEVHAHPDDDGPRQVVADALIERGDPRGEWIALDLARARGALDVEGQRRQRALATDGEIATWAQPLSASGRVTFERGFPSAIRLYKYAEPLVAHPALATVTRIDGICRPRRSDPVALLDHPATARVREVFGFSSRVLAKACATPRAWTAISVRGPRPSAELLARLPALRDLDVHAIDDDYRFAVPSQLVRLAIEMWRRAVELDLHAAPDLRTLVLRSRAEAIACAPDQLATLELAELGSAPPSFLASQQRSLTSLVVGRRYGWSGERVPFAAPELRSLVWRTLELRQVPALPKLEHLEVRRPEAPSELYALLAAIPTLRSLVLYDVGPRRGRLLHAAKHLERFELR